MRPQQISNIRYHTPKKNQISDITPPKKSNIRYPGTCTPVPPPPPHLNMFYLKEKSIWTEQN